MFAPQHGTAWLIRVLGTVILFIAAVGVLQLVPRQFRKYVIQGVTFLGGAFFALEFFLPVHPMPTAANPKAVGNFITPFVDPVSNWLTIVSAFTVGLGVINLSSVHFKRLTRGGNNALNSAVFVLAMFVMCIMTILAKEHPNQINKDVFDILFSGALASLDGTMFSIIAFYIVSAAYRAFRVRSTEATILLLTAVIVMMGQIAIGQFITHKLPSTGVFSVFRFEIARQWILDIANTAAVRAIGFGLGIGGLAVALRLWLGLERGSYFDSQG